MTRDRRPVPDPIATTGAGQPAAGRAGAGGAVAGTSRPGDVDQFLTAAKRLAPAATGQAGRLVFALDATMSRQPTWDLACRLQAEMFHTAARTGGLMVQLVYFRGFMECRASSWVADPARLTGLMSRIGCEGGHTQIGKVLAHVRDEAARAETGGRVRAFVMVGDAMEENADALCAIAGELGLRGIRGFMFLEGHDALAESTFREIARLTGGAFARFDPNSPRSLADLLRGAAAYASGGQAALKALAAREPAAAGLIAAMDRSLGDRSAGR